MTLDAELYALTHRGNAGDAEFYQRVCAGARSVLELGAGYGRLLGPLARSAPRVVGLELEPGLLALARRSVRRLPSKQQGRIRLVHDDMRSFRLEQQFERVLLPYNALFCLLNEREALACLRSAHAALRDGGVLALDVWNAERFHRLRSTRGARAAPARPLFTVEHRGRSWTVSEHTRLGPRQRLEVRYDYQAARGARRSQRIPQRYFRARELRALLARAGFALRSLHGDFDGARYTPSSAQLVLTASKL